MLRILAEALACSPLQDALFWLRSIEKGGPRDDDIFPALSPAWPGQRPANAFAGLTRDFYRTSSWSALRGYAALRVLALAPAFSGYRDRRQDQRTIMTLINIRDLGVTLSAPLFSRLNLVVNAGDRIGLVAANGRGKSTLLRCLAGTMEASEGEITRSRGLTVGYVEQNVPEALMDRPFQ